MNNLQSSNTIILYFILKKNFIYALHFEHNGQTINLISTILLEDKT